MWSMEKKTRQTGKKALASTTWKVTHTYIFPGCTWLYLMWGDLYKVYYRVKSQILVNDNNMMHGGFSLNFCGWFFGIGISSPCLNERIRWRSESWRTCWKVLLFFFEFQVSFRLAELLVKVWDGLGRILVNLTFDQWNIFKALNSILTSRSGSDECPP